MHFRFSHCAAAALLGQTTVLVPSLALATVPQGLTEQGRLFDDNGNPLSAAVSLTFSLYTVASGGTAVWTETQPAVILDNGYFSVEVGSVTPIPQSVWTGAAMFVGIAVNADPEMTPRQSTYAVPYALVTNDAIGDVHPTSVSVNGTLVINGSGQWVGSPAGLLGPTGATGAQGAIGVAGAAGSAGPQGPQGPTGAVGAQGPTGVQGPTGADGPVGAQGAAGATGSAGAQGAAGSTGAQGAAGSAGAQGTAASSPLQQIVSTLDWPGPSTTIGVGSYPFGLAFDGTNLWVANDLGNNVTVVLAGSGIVVGNVPVGAAPSSLVFDGTYIWVTNTTNSNVTKILASTGTVVGTVNVGGNPEGVAFDGTSIWVTNNASNNVTKILASTGTVVGTVNVGSYPYGVAFDGTNIWVTNQGSNNVTRILASTGTVAGTTAVGSNPLGIAFDGTNMWVTNVTGGTVTKILASTGTVAGTIPVGGNPNAVVFDGANLWVTNYSDNDVTKILASTGTMVGTFNVGGGPNAIAFDGSSVWVANSFDNTVTRLFEGSPGAQGGTGATGATGAQGATGPQGANGFLQAGGAAGAVPYWTGSAWNTTASELYYKGGNVGIGTTSPTQALDTGTGSIHASGFQLNNGGTNYGKLAVANGTASPNNSVSTVVPWSSTTVANNQGMSFVWTANGPIFGDTSRCGGGADPSFVVGNSSDLGWPGQYTVTFSTGDGFPTITGTWEGWELRLFNAAGSVVAGSANGFVHFTLAYESGAWRVEQMSGAVGTTTFECD